MRIMMLDVSGLFRRGNAPLLPQSSSSPVASASGSSSDLPLLCRFIRVGNRTFCLANTLVSSVVGMTPGNFLAELWGGLAFILHLISCNGSLYCEWVGLDLGQYRSTLSSLATVHESDA